eukprot:scaffold16007_cov65-Phaeocystis_antarctica.AAC.7
MSTTRGGADELGGDHRVDRVLERDLVGLELQAELRHGAALDLARLAQHARGNVHLRAHLRHGQLRVHLLKRREDVSDGRHVRRHDVPPLGRVLGHALAVHVDDVLHVNDGEVGRALERVLTAHDVSDAGHRAVDAVVAGGDRADAQVARHDHAHVEARLGREGERGPLLVDLALHVGVVRGPLRLLELLVRVVDLRLTPHGLGQGALVVAALDRRQRGGQHHALHARLLASRQHRHGALDRGGEHGRAALGRVREAVLGVDRRHVEDAVHARERLRQRLLVGQVLDLGDRGAERREVRTVLGDVTHGAANGVAVGNERLDQLACDEACAVDA